MAAATISGNGASATPALISVIMPVLNEERHIGAALAALSQQTYEGSWELLVVDNGCSDRSMAIARAARGLVPALRIVDATAQPGINYARNAGVLAARGDFLAFCDADDVASPSWLAEMARAARDGDVVGGALESERINGSLALHWCRQRVMTRLPDDGFFPYVPGGNCGVHARVAQELRWDEDFRFGSSDIEFSWRAGLSGYRLQFAIDAVIHRRLRDDLWGLARQSFAYGRSEPHLYRKFRHHGMPGSGVRAAAGTWGWLARHLPDLVSLQRRGRWIRRLSRHLGRVAGSIERRTLFL